jgi:hypothetical protein
MLAAALLAMTAAGTVPGTLTCDAAHATEIIRIPLGGFTRFHAQVHVQLAPKGGPALVFESAGAKERAILFVSVMAPPLGDGSYPPIWSTTIAGPAGMSRGTEFAVTSDFELDLWQDPDRTAHMRLKWRDSDGTAREGGTQLLTGSFAEGSFDLGCSAGRFELTGVTVE